MNKPLETGTFFSKSIQIVVRGRAEDKKNTPAVVVAPFYSTALPQHLNPQPEPEPYTPPSNPYNPTEEDDFDGGWEDEEEEGTASKLLDGQLSKHLEETVSKQENALVYPAYGDFRKSNWLVAGHGNISLNTCGTVSKFFYCKKCGVIPSTEHCDKPECPECYELWAKRRAKMIGNRLVEVLNAYKNKGFRMRISHYALSVPKHYYSLFETPEGYRQLRKDAIKLLRACGVNGGVAVCHSHRQNRDKQWYVSPHFHVLGAGYIQIKDAVDAGWVLKKIGEREKPHGVARYILSHAGVYSPIKRISTFKRSTRPIYSISWFGSFSVAHVRTVITYKMVERRCTCGCLLYSDEGCACEAWRLTRIYSYRLRPNPPPKYLEILGYSGTVKVVV